MKLIDTIVSNFEQFVDDTIRWFKKYSFIGTFIVIILTAYVTSRFNFYSSKRMSDIEYDRAIREKQIENISDLVKSSTKINYLRRKIYWNKYLAHTSLLDKDNDEARSLLEREVEYRSQYEDYCSDFDAAFYMSITIFDLDKEMLVKLDEIHDALPFPYDTSTIESMFLQLQKEGVSKEEMYDKLDEQAEAQFSNDYYDKVMEYINLLRTELDPN